jgi:hypothetical protein
MSVPMPIRILIASVLTLAFLVALTSTSSAHPLQPAMSELARTPTPTTIPSPPTPPTGSIRVSCVGNGGAGVKISWDYEHLGEGNWSVGLLFDDATAYIISLLVAPGQAGSGQWIAHPADGVSTISLVAQVQNPWALVTLDEADNPDCSRGASL